jgi:hypothetical protein
MEDPLTEALGIINREAARLDVDGYEAQIDATMQRFSCDRGFAIKIHDRYERIVRDQARKAGMDARVYNDSIPQEGRTVMVGMAVGIEMTLRNYGIS